MRSATVAAVMLVSIVLTGCAGGSSDGSDTEPSSSSDVSPTETGPATEDAAAIESVDDLVGRWTAADADWEVSFSPDGRFVEDVNGVETFRTGTYELLGRTVRLIGGDGNTDEGRIEGDRLIFELGTLERQ